MVHGKCSKGQILEEKQLKRYRRSLKRTRAKSRNPSGENDEKAKERRPVEGFGEKADGRRPVAGKTTPSSSAADSPTSKQGPRPVNELKLPALDVIVNQVEDDLDQTAVEPVALISDEELPPLETAEEVKAPVSVIVTAEKEELPKGRKSFETPSTRKEPIQVIVTEDKEEVFKNVNVNEEISRLEELAAKAKAVASWKRSVSPARNTVAEEKSAAAVEETPEIGKPDNLKVIDSAAGEAGEGKASKENTANSETDVKVEEPAIRSNKKSEEISKEEEFDFEESLGWTVQGRKGRKGKKGLSKLKGIISELKAEEVEKKELPEEPKILSFEEAAKEVEAESAFARRIFAASLSGDVKVQQEEADTDSSGWEVIEVSEDSEDEVTDVTKEVKEKMNEEENGCSQRWVEEMNEKNRKKMEQENKATDSSTSYSQSTFWREPISQVPNLPNLPKEEKMVEPKKVMEEKKPAGISLPTSEMTFAWMEDDAAMGAIDTDDEMEEVKDKKPEIAKPAMSYAEAAKKVEEVKPKGIALPTEEMTFDWMNDDEALGTMDSDDEVPDNRDSLRLDLKTPAEIPERKDDVPEQFSPVQYWRDPIPDILDPEEPLKNAEKSEKKSEKPKPPTPKAAKPKSWLASNMAGMFDRKPKQKAKVEQVSRKKESEDKAPSSLEIKDVKTSTISNSSKEAEVKSITREAKEQKKAKEATIQTEANQKQNKPKIPIHNEKVWLDKWRFDDAEARFYEKESSKRAENVERESLTREVGNKEKGSVEIKPKRRIVKEMTEEIHEKVEVYKVPEKMESKVLKEKLTSIEAENKDLRKSLAKLSEHIRALTARVNLLEKESSDEGVDLSYRSPTASAPFCPHYTDCTCLANR